MLENKGRKLRASVNLLEYHVQNMYIGLYRYNIEHNINRFVESLYLFTNSTEKNNKPSTGLVIQKVLQRCNKSYVMWVRFTDQILLYMI